MNAAARAIRAFNETENEKEILTTAIARISLSAIICAFIFITVLSSVSAAEIQQTTFTLGDTVIIHTTPGATGMTLSSGSGAYRYLGTLDSVIAFKPQAIGDYVITETLADSTTVDTAFSVINQENMTPNTTDVGVPSIQLPQQNLPEVTTPSNAAVGGLTPKKQFVVQLHDNEEQLQQLNAKIRLRTSRGTGWIASIDARDGATRFTGSTGDLGANPPPMRHANVRLSLNGKIQQVDLQNADISNGLSLGVDDVDENKVNMPINDRRWVSVYALDPTNVSFTNGTLTANATGNELYKCIDWDFANQNCAGTWTKIMDLTPGEQYQVPISAADPGFGETVISTGVTIAADLNNLYITGSIPAPLRNGRTPLGVVVSNPTNVTYNISKIQIIASANMFGGAFGIVPSTGWVLSGTNTVNWSGSVVLGPYSAAEFNVNVTGASTNTANILVSVNATTNVTNISNGGYITHINNAAIQSPGVYFVNASNQSKFIDVNGTQNITDNYTIRVDNMPSGTTAIAVKSQLLMFFPPGWTDLALPAQAGWTTGTVLGDEGSGYIMMPYVSGTTIIGGASRDFTFNITAPNGDTRNLYVWYGRFLGAAATNTKAMETTFEPGIAVPNTTRLLDAEDERYYITKTEGGSSTIDQYAEITCPIENIGTQNRWGTVVVNPTDWNITVTQIDFTADAAVFATVAGITPANTWTVITPSDIQWTGSVTIPPHDAAEFVGNFMGNATVTASATVTITTVTSNQTLVTSGFRTAQSSASNMPFASMTWLNSSGRQTYILENITPQTKATFTVRINDSGSNAAIPLNTLLEIHVPSGFTNVTAASGTNWTIRQIVSDPSAGSIIRAIVATAAIAAGGTRDFSFNTTTPQVGGNSTYRIDALLIGGTGQATTDIIESHSQLALQIRPSVYGINITHKSDVVGNINNVSSITVTDYAKALTPTAFNFSILNTRTNAYETIRSATLGTAKEDWNITLTNNRTLDPRDYINKTAGTPDFGKIAVRWYTTSNNQTSLMEDLLNYSTVNDTIVPNVTLFSPLTGNYTNLSNVNFTWNATDNYDIENCSLLINNTINQTNSSPANGTNILNATLADGDWNWSVQCFDLVGNANITSRVTFVVDTVPPKAALNRPLNNTNFSTSYVQFNYTPADNHLSSCGVYINNTLNATNFSVSTGVPNFFNLSIADGDWNWTVACNDSAGNFFINTTNYKFIVDTTAPTTSNPTTEPASGSVYNTSQLYRFNTSFTDIHGINASIFESNFSGILTNRTVNVTSGAIRSYNLSSLAAGTYQWRFYANDTFGNMAAGPLQTYVISRAPSNITIFLNNTQANYPAIIGELINITAIMVVPANGYMEIQVNNTMYQNGTGARLTNLTSFPANQTYNITVIYNATQNYSASQATLLVIVGDKSGPIVNLTYPASNGFTNQINVTFFFNATDQTGVANCTLYVNGTINNTRLSNLVNNGQNNITGYNFTEGNYSYKVSCTDPLGNIANSTTFNFTVDLTLPTAFSLSTPANGTTSKNMSPTFTWTATVEKYFANYTILVDNAQDFSSPNYIYNTTAIGTTSYAMPDALNDQVVWYWKVIAYDLAGNGREAGFFTYRTDNVSPVISIVNPLNNSYLNTTNFNITYTFADFSNVTNCTVRFNDSTSQSNTTLNQSGGSVFFVVKAQADYLWNITCVDIANNTNTTDNFLLYIDTTPPTSVTLITPANKTFSNNNEPFLSWSQTTEAHFKNYTILVSDNNTFSHVNMSYGTFNTVTNTSYQVTTPWTDGKWYWKVVVWDLAGNSADPFFEYTIDSTPPGPFDLDKPNNDTSNNSRTPTLNWTNTSDINFANYTVLVSDHSDMSVINFTYNMTNVSNTTLVVTAPWTDNTIWYWRVVAWDNATNSQNSTNTFVYIADNLAPNVSLASPQNASTYSSSTSSLVPFEFNVSDLSGVVSCTLTVNNSVSLFSTTSYFIVKDKNQTLYQSLSNGDYNWSVSCTDAAGNKGVSSRNQLNVSVTLPTSRLYEASSYDNPQTSATANWSAVAVYRSQTLSGVNFPKYQTWNGTGWSAEAEMPTAGSPIRWVKMASNPLLGRAYEKAVVTVSDDGWLDAYVWNGSAWNVWNNLASIGTTSNADRSFDIEYETQRGRAILVYAYNSTIAGQELAYRIWNGSSWLPQTFIDDPSIATNFRADYIRVARDPDPNANELAVAYIDATNADARAMIWSGSSWTKFMNITNALSITTEEDVAIAYEQQSYKILAVAGNTSLVQYTSYDRTAWSTPLTTDINPSAAGTTNFLTLKPNPAGNEIIITGVDGQATPDLSTALWSGGTWSGALRHDAAVDTGTERVADFEWEPTGSSGILVWGTTTGQLAYKTFSTVSSWGAQNNIIAGASTHNWVVLRRIFDARTGDMMIVGGTDDATGQLDSLTWDGTTLNDTAADFSANQGIIAYQAFDLYGEQYAPRTLHYANITINATIDGTENDMTADGAGLLLLTNATSVTMSNFSTNGYYLPAAGAVTFSNVIAAMNPGVSYLTWQAYLVNSSGEYFICSDGNLTRTAGDIVVDSTDRTAYAGSCAASSGFLFQPSDQLRVYTWINNSANNTVTKYVDNLSTYIELDGYPLGNLTLRVTTPTTDPKPGEGTNFTFTCTANCTGGYCLNVRVYNELNNSLTTFNATDYFRGNVLLNSTTQNPILLGTINSTVNASFDLVASFYSANNTLRCNATSDFVNTTSNKLNVSVMDLIYPNVTLIDPSNGDGLAPGFITFLINASDRRLGSCSLWTNTTGTWRANQTITPNNFTQTSFAPVNVSAFGTYKWNVNCSDLAGNDNFSSSNFTFTIAGDVWVNSSEITFSPLSPIEGSNTTILAIIRNNVNRNETNFNVSFFLGDPRLPGATQIGGNVTIAQLNASGNVTVNQTLLATIGQSNIFVLVDPPYGGGVIFEYNETNNLANNTLIVSSWQTYYGSVVGNFTLGAATNFTFGSWTLMNFSGNIYVACAGTSNGITWSALKPIGRNTTGGVNANTLDDFTEIDTLLNMTNYTDSVNISYTSLGTPVATQTFPVYSNTLTGVPVANSSSDGNFTTGILWDSQDGTSSYFKASDNDDIVFVTNITARYGKFGLVNYEVRVPSKLKGYKGTSGMVTLYYEIR